MSKWSKFIHRYLLTYLLTYLPVTVNLEKGGQADLV